MKKLFFVLTAVASLFLTSCSDDDDSVTTNLLSFNITGLEDLGSDYVYEGWVITPDGPVTTGRFTSITVSQNFVVAQATLDVATQFVLTIEPANETGTELTTPADTKYLEGTFSNNQASLSITNVVADINTTSATGQFILATPTDNPTTTNNDEDGIWWFDMANGTAGLTLPTLNAGWVYEGWVVVDINGTATPVSTGTFSDPTMADSTFGANVGFNGADASGPAYPGEDFLQNLPTGFPDTLIGGTAVISVEPVPDNSTAPFTLKPLSATIGADLAPTLQNMTFSNTSFPTGTVTKS